MTSQIFALMHFHGPGYNDTVCVSENPDKLHEHAVSMLHGRDRRVMRNAYDDLTRGQVITLDGGHVSFEIRRIPLL